MSEFKSGWVPVEPAPLAEHVAVVGALRDDEPVAELLFVDVTGDTRIIQCPVNTALSLQAQLAAFLVTAARR